VAFDRHFCMPMALAAPPWQNTTFREEKQVTHRFSEERFACVKAFNSNPNTGSQDIGRKSEAVLLLAFSHSSFPTQSSLTYHE
jgi:hypothetical protein